MKRYASFRHVSEHKVGKVFLRLLIVLSAVGLILLLLPWTQNIRATGQVTALRPDQRPQTIHTIIPGRIEKWFVQEGDLVKKGDTILFISEVKDDYMDPEYLSRINDQLQAKELTVKSYMEKVRAMDQQIDALSDGLHLKLDQARNKLIQARLKVESDSMKLEAMNTNLDIANQQYQRMQELHAKGLKSLTDLETRKSAMQEARAYVTAQENMLISSRNEVINAEIELSSLSAEYRDKISKSESEKFASLSSMYDAEAAVTKLQNQYMNYSIRTGMYYITAPQDGYITQAIKTGIGETVKEGAEIISIMPANYDLAIEMYVRPIDIPLLQKNSRVRVQFDGWPAIIFSGWPGVSYGTYGGRVVAIDNFISQGGYRVLVAPDPEDHPWPRDIRIGGGVNTMTLLQDVPVWYELWRKINGFPPEYYAQPEPEKKAS